MEILYIMFLCIQFSEMFYVYTSLCPPGKVLFTRPSSPRQGVVYPSLCPPGKVSFTRTSAPRQGVVYPSLCPSGKVSLTVPLIPRQGVGCAGGVGWCHAHGELLAVHGCVPLLGGLLPRGAVLLRGSSELPHGTHIHVSERTQGTHNHVSERAHGAHYSCE